jgi:hypothetical protein
VCPVSGSPIGYPDPHRAVLPAETPLAGTARRGSGTPPPASRSPATPTRWGRRLRSWVGPRSRSVGSATAPSSSPAAKLDRGAGAARRRGISPAFLSRPSVNATEPTGGLDGVEFPLRPMIAVTVDQLPLDRPCGWTFGRATVGRRDDWVWSRGRNVTFRGVSRPRSPWPVTRRSLRLRLGGLRPADRQPPVRQESDGHRYDPSFWSSAHSGPVRFSIRHSPMPGGAPRGRETTGCPPDAVV